MFNFFYILNVVYDSITERFFRAQGPKTKLFERFLLLYPLKIYNVKGKIGKTVFYFKNQREKNTIFFV